MGQFSNLGHCEFSYCTSDRNYLFWSSLQWSWTNSNPKRSGHQDVIESGRDLFRGSRGRWGSLHVVIVPWNLWQERGRKGDLVRKDPDCAAVPHKLLPSQHKVVSWSPCWQHLCLSRMACLWGRGLCVRRMAARPSVGCALQQIWEVILWPAWVLWAVLALLGWGDRDEMDIC